MAIVGTPIKLNKGRKQTETAETKSRTELYYVRTEFGVGDELEIALSHSLFKKNRRHDTVRGLFLREKNATLMTEGSISQWLVECSYDNASNSSGNGGDGGGIDPLDMAPYFDWGSWSYPEAIVQDRQTSGYIQNLASDPVLNPSVTEDLHNPMVTITLNQAKKIQDHLRLGVGRMNAKAFTIQDVVIPPYCAMLKDYVTNEQKKPNSDEVYVKARYTFHLNFDLVGERTYTLDAFSQGSGPQITQVNAKEFKGFRRKLLNAGTRKYSYSDLKHTRISDGSGGFISEPVPLNKQGQPFKTIALGQEVYLLWNTLDVADFSTYPTKRKN